MPRSNTTSQEKIGYLERRPQVLAMRKGGASLRQIADHFGISHEQVRQDIKAALADIIAETRDAAEEYRALELDRLDALHLALWPQATKGNLGAVDRVLRVMQRRADLLGLDAPQRIVNLTPEDAEKLTDTELEAELKKRGLA